MSESKTVGASDQASVPPSRRRFSDDFKRHAVRLIVEEEYSFKAAAEAVGVCEKTLRQWRASSSFRRRARAARGHCGIENQLH